MNFLNNFQSELISQTSIVHYIEFQFEQELNKVRRYLNVEIKDELYNNNSNYMKLILSTCDELLSRNSKSYVAEKELPAIARNVDVREPIGEVIEYCIETLEDGGKLGVAELKQELDKINKENDEDYCYYDFTEQQIEEMIDSAYIIKDYRKNYELKEQDEMINSFKTSIKLVDNSSLSNIFRQSFINIFSIFDAYVFEYIEEFFCAYPKELSLFLEVKNNEKIKFTLDEVVDFEDIENLKNEMLHKQLAGRHLSELINKLKKYRPSLFTGVEYPVLMEMIERRNIHLHNKGIVDEKYCSFFNIYHFYDGEYAFIDDKYLFTIVFNTLSQFTKNMEKELNIDNVK